LKALFIDKQFIYDGSQLRSLFAYLEHGVLGTSVVAWQGPCNIPFSHMVDGEDLLAMAKIEGNEMLHFIIEVFDRGLFSGVVLQRLFASIVRDYLQKAASSLLQEQGKVLDRFGDDIFLDDHKLSISIATKSPVSVMIHFAMNITNEGTPVKTLSLQDLMLDPKNVANELMSILAKEYFEIVEATQKVRPIA
jgi:hypothetical protein